MKESKKQIQQLSEAHRAVHSAVSGINAMQDLLALKEQTGESTLDEEAIPQRQASTRTNRSMASNRSDFQEQQDRPEQPANQPAGAERQGWVDEDYYKENPWYGRAKSKPVFSLGHPLPHTSRGKKKKKGKTQKGNSDLEKGQPEAKNEYPYKKRVRIADETDAPLEHHDGDNAEARKVHSSKRGDADQLVRDSTAAGKAHSSKRNDAGQPVYDYVPQESDSQSREDDWETDGDGYEEGKKYKVDGEPVGQRENDEAEEGEVDPDELRNWWARLRAKYPEPLAEFLATSMSVFLGLCATLSVNLSASQETQYGTYETSCWAWGFAFMFGIYIGGGVSGAHMSPAISICLSLFRGFPWRQCAIYIAIQFLASFTAAALAYGIYYEAIHYADPEMQSSYKSFFSYPQTWVSPGTAVGNQCVAGAVMMIAVFALGDDQNNPPGAGMHAFILGMLQTTLKFCLGYNTGSSLNPASDFGPRVVAYAVGYRTPEIFSDPWWIYGPWIAALVGSLAGCVCYDSMIFVGTESPINYRVPKAFRNRVKKAKKITNKF
ncbi:putative glycerol uptake facilitator protein [Eutypa lata UCREL1]|uniref:Putative glycerol uptake facilitator protein n=1 Tax=Eutypa lata (strain UCR-EL1) TaxID=1287681 RepID=M7SMJ1_EUTLA|nr:putative glycerol uptake facilitator protein [Eutypa lata UCREL1]